MNKPSADELDEIWSDDLMGRRVDAEFIVEFIVGRIAERRKAQRTATFVLNIDAKWGQGKTYFLLHLKRYTQAIGYPGVYINAWANDHAEDAMIAVVSEIDLAIAPLIGRNKTLAKAWRITRRVGLRAAGSTARAIGRTAGRKLLGEGLAEVSEIFRDGDKAGSVPAIDIEPNIIEDEFDKLLDVYAEKMVAAFRKTNESVNDFKVRLASTIKTLASAAKCSSPLFVFVDELDRCRPSYAIELLERIKHLFDTDGVVFVVATDTEQLRHSVSAVYGHEFDSKRYLNRFFDRRYTFSEPPKRAFITSLIGEIDLHKLRAPYPEIPDFVIELFSASDLSLRDIEQCIDIFRTIVTMWSRKAKLELSVLLPLIIFFQRNE